MAVGRVRRPSHPGKQSVPNCTGWGVAGLARSGCARAGRPSNTLITETLVTQTQVPEGTFNQNTL